MGETSIDRASMGRLERGLAFADVLKAWLPQGMTLGDMALRWILDQPAASTVIAGVTKPHQLKANAAASTLPPLPADLVQRLRDFYQDKVRPEVRGGV